MVSYKLINDFYSNPPLHKISCYLEKLTFLDKNAIFIMPKNALELSPAEFHFNQNLLGTTCSQKFFQKVFESVLEQKTATASVKKYHSIKIVLQPLPHFYHGLKRVGH